MNIIIGIGLVVVLWIVVKSMGGKKEGASLPSLKTGTTTVKRSNPTMREEIGKIVDQNPAQAAGSLRAMMADLETKKKKK